MAFQLWRDCPGDSGAPQCPSQPAQDSLSLLLPEGAATLQKLGGWLRLSLGETGHLLSPQRNSLRRKRPSAWHGMAPALGFPKILLSAGLLLWSLWLYVRDCGVTAVTVCVCLLSVCVCVCVCVCVFWVARWEARAGASLSPKHPQTLSCNRSLAEGLNDTVPFRGAA